MLATILVVASLLRFVDLDLIEFKGDEAVSIHMALPIVEGKGVPTAGLMSSVGIHNPPMFIYAVAVPSLFSVDARFVTAGLVGLLSVLAVFLTFSLFWKRLGVVTALWAAAFYATCTWPVLYGRKLWAQDVLPALSVVLLHVLVRVWERPRTRWVAAAPVLVCVMWQLHFSALILAPVVAVMLLARRRALAWGWLGLGIVLALLLTTPYVIHQVRHDYRDFRGLMAMAKGESPDGKAKQKGKLSLLPVQWATYIGPGASVDYSLGPSAEDFAEFEAGLPRAVRRAATMVGWVLLGLGLLWALWRRGATAGVLLAWTLGYLGLFVLVRLDKVFPHYFIILFPAQFLLLAAPLGEAARRWGRTGLVVGGAVGLFVVTAHAAGLSSYRDYLRERGGAAGDYGVIYEHKQDLVDWALGNGLTIERGAFEFHHMLRMARDYGDLDRAREAAAKRPHASDTRKRIRIHDRLRHPTYDPKCRGRQDFGPLTACPVR